MQTLFDEIDVDGSGAIDVGEFGVALGKLGKVRASGLGASCQLLRTPGSLGLPYPPLTPPDLLMSTNTASGVPPSAP